MFVGRTKDGKGWVLGESRLMCARCRVNEYRMIIRRRGGGVSTGVIRHSPVVFFGVKTHQRCILSVVKYFKI